MVWLAAAVIVGGSLLAVIYVWKVIEYAYLRSPTKHTEKYSTERNEAPLQMLIPLWILVAANFYFGLKTSFSYGFAHSAINALFL